MQKFREDPREEGDIYVPSYQRTLQWEEERQSLFIESLILRIPVPPVFFYEREGRLEIVDGSQRIRTLVNFVRGNLSLEGLEKLDVINGMTFGQLPEQAAKRLLNTPIRSFVLEQGTDQSTRVELFRRINTSPKALTDAEIRIGIFQGPFLELVLSCAARDPFTTMVTGQGTRGNKNPESERQELVTRFFVYGKFYQEFVHDVRKFLDDKFIRLNTQMSLEDGQAMSDEFDRVMAFIHTHMPRAFYPPGGGVQVPRVRFEAVAVGTALALRQNPTLHPGSISWLESQEFARLVRTDASNSGPKLRGRIEFVRDHLLG